MGHLPGCRLAPIVPMPVPGHPHAAYATKRDRHGQFWIHFWCYHCRDHTVKLCSRPHMTGHWVLQYATLHGHGLRPQMAGPPR